MPISISSNVEVPHDPGTVAAVALDWANDERWRAAVRHFEVDPPGPAHRGQRLVEHLSFAGLRFRTPTEVTTAGTDFAEYAGGNAMFGVRGARRVRPVAGGTRVETHLELTPRGPMRLLAPLLAPSYRRSDAADLQALARMLGPRRG